MKYSPSRDHRKAAQLLLPLLGLAMSFLVSGIMLIFFGIDPLKTFSSIFSRAFGTVSGLSQTVTCAIPMLIVASGIDFARRAGVFNLGAEGQMMFGAVGAQIAAMQTQSLSPIPAIAITLLGGLVFGALWALVPTLLKAVFSVNEVVVLIMMNQIAAYLLGYLVRVPLKDPTNSNNQSALIPEAAKLPLLIPGTQIHLGLVIALILVAVLWFIHRKTSYGYRISVVGTQTRAAEYAGISVSNTILLTFLLSGAIAGLAGANQVAGLKYRLTGTITNGYGWVGLTVAMISGENPFMIILVSILYSALQVGGLVIQITQHVPMELANIIQAITVLFVMCAENIYKLIDGKRNKKRRLPALPERRTTQWET